MYSIAFFIVELQFAKTRLLKVFDAPDATTDKQIQSAPNVKGLEAARPTPQIETLN
jgi:hypothetical protein